MIIIAQVQNNDTVPGATMGEGMEKHGESPAGADIKGYLKPHVIQAGSYILSTGRTQG